VGAGPSTCPRQPHGIAPTKLLALDSFSDSLRWRGQGRRRRPVSADSSPLLGFQPPFELLQDIGAKSSPAETVKKGVTFGITVALYYGLTSSPINDNEMNMDGIKIQFGKLKIAIHTLLREAKFAGCKHLWPANLAQLRQMTTRTINKPRSRHTRRPARCRTRAR